MWLSQPRIPTPWLLPGLRRPLLPAAPSLTGRLLPPTPFRPFSRFPILSFPSGISASRPNILSALLTLQKTSFRGLSLGEAKCHPSALFFPIRRPPSPSTNASRRLDISARTAGAAKNIEVEVDKPLGLTLGQKPGGGVVISVSCSLTSLPSWGRLSLLGLSVGQSFFSLECTAEVMKSSPTGSAVCLFFPSPFPLVFFLFTLCLIIGGGRWRERSKSRAQGWGSSSLH